MSGISPDVMDWRNNFRISEVDELFRTGALFTARGFSHATIKALVRGGIDAPERLLFADEAELASIPGLDKVALEEVERYRAQFFPNAHENQLGPGSMFLPQRSERRVRVLREREPGRPHLGQ
jgi:hypothetical protein